LLGIPAGTARSRLHYAIAGLRDALTTEPEPIVQEGRPV
jgi:DNA-directed RNA polymerase specialized sigma24 family protein